MNWGLQFQLDEVRADLKALKIAANRVLSTYDWAGTAYGDGDTFVQAVHSLREIVEKLEAKR